MRAKSRLALYGGTFDPVHLGHLEVARAVAQFFEIEKVLFIPAQVAPHKLGRPVTAPLHRYAMLALATQDDPQLAVSTFEIEAPDRRYTVDTLDHFINVCGETSDLFFIMGADSWTEITTWREWSRVLTIVNHIVVTRPGYELDGPKEMAARIVDLRVANAAKPPGVGNDTRIYLTDIVMRDVAATQIRSLAVQKRFRDLTQFVPVSVANYLEKYAIYQEPNEAQFNR
jgi:nicotinate-nucleotide adenylyltransferase